jgi:hypothetical protein
MNSSPHRWLSAALVTLLWSPLMLAQPTKPTGATRMQELEATIAELKAGRDDAPKGMQKGVDQQIEALENAKKLQQMTDEANEKNKGMRPQLTEEAKKFFTPVAPAKLPVWIPDTLTRAEAKEEMLKCPAGATVFASDDAMECRLPPKSKGGIPPPHGLALWFYKSTGKLKGQRYYENGLLRWSISYHHTGGRDGEGMYDDEKSKQHRQSGLHTSYAPNGTIVRQAAYKSGVLQGWSKLWEDDGYPMSATRYENNKSAEMVGPTLKKM